MARPQRDPIIVGNLKLDLVVACTLGVISLAAVLTLTFSGLLVDDFQKSVVWTLLAFGVSGAAVFIPGIIEVNIPKVAKAAGAIAIFVLIFSQSPVGKDIKDTIFPRPDSKSIEFAINEFFGAIDQHSYSKAFQLTSDWSQRVYPLDVFLRVAKNEHEPLGKPVERLQVGVQGAQDPSGLPRGAYLNYRYRTVFANAPDTKYIESILLKKEEKTWVVYNYNLAKEQ